MSINFVIEMYDIGIPLKNTININTILSFYNYYNKQTDFYQWINQNQLNILKITSQEKNKIIDNYTQIDIDNIYR